MQEDSLGLYGCIENYNPDSENLFLTYASPAIRNAMIDYIRSQSVPFEAKHLNDTISLDELYHALDMIRDREARFLRYRFGFDDDIPHPLTETAKHFTLSLSRAKSTEARAIDNVWLELPWWYEQHRTLLPAAIIKVLLAIEKLLDECASRK